MAKQVEILKNAARVFLINIQQRIGLLQQNEHFKTGLVLAYAALVIWGAAHHEPWRDEADTWVIARDASFQDFLRYFGYSGHPPLWHLILLPFARLGLPFETQAVLHILFAIGAVSLFVFYSPLPLYIKIPFIFSMHMAYQYAVVSRGYALLTLLLFVIATIYKKRLERPILYGSVLALLANTEVFAWPIAGILILSYFYELFKAGKAPSDLVSRRRYMISIGIACMGTLLSVVAVWPPSDLQHAVHGFKFYPDAFLCAIQRAMMPLYDFDYLFDGYISKHEFFTSPLFAFIMTHFAVAVIELQFIIFWRKWLPFSILLGSLAWYAFICTFKYFGYFWHAVLIVIFSIFALWIAEDHYRKATDGKYFRGALLGILSLFLIYSCFVSLFAHRYDYFNNYSAGKAMAHYIKENHLEDHIMAVVGCHEVVTLAAYLGDTTVWNANQMRFSRYIKWDGSFDMCHDKERQLRAVDAQFDQKEHLLVATDEAISSPSSYRLELLHQVTGFWESFWLYKPVAADQRTQTP